VKDMFLLLVNWLKSGEVGQVGINYRSLGFHKSFSYLEVQNVYNVFGFDRELFNSLNLRCDHTDHFLSDIQITLGLISMGYKNRVIYDYALSQSPGSAGGCFSYRSFKNQYRSVKKVNEVFPRYTEVYQRVSKSKIELPEWRKYDLKVFWKKAFREGYCNRKSTIKDLLK